MAVVACEKAFSMQKYVRETGAGSLYCINKIEVFK